MPDPTQTEAPAADPIAPPLTASEQAVVADDFAGFRTAQQAVRTGKPLPSAPSPDPPLPAPAQVASVVDTPPAPAPVDRTVSKRQQQINDYERRLAEQTERIARLEGQLAAPASPRREPASAPAPTPAAEYKRFLAMPEAPKLDDFDSIPEHTAAMALFIADTRHDERTKADREQRDRTQASDAFETRVAKYSEQMAAAKVADPDFLTHLSAEVQALKPFAALQAGETPSARNAIAEEILSSPVAPQLMRHFSDHPEDLRRIERLAPREIVRAMSQLDARFEAPPVAAIPAPKTVTEAPPPPTTLGTRSADPVDPERRAVVSDDFPAFRIAKREQRAALQGRR